MSRESQNAATPDDRHVSRLELVWDVVIFQFKLAFDGLRDVLLIPLSIVAAILGLVAGGDEPDRHFKQLLRFGRRTEAWLNLFGYRRHGETSDKLIRPLQDKVMQGALTNPWLSKTGTRLNRHLDSVNASVSPAGSNPNSGAESPETNSDR